MVSSILICSLFVLIVGSFTISDVFATEHGAPFTMITVESTDGVNYNVDCSLINENDLTISLLRFLVYLIDIDSEGVDFTDPDTFTLIHINEGGVNSNSFSLNNFKLKDGKKLDVACVVYYPIPPDGNLDVFSVTKIFPEPSIVSSSDGNKNGGGCGNCVPPTLGLDLENKRLVDNGFSYNGHLAQVEFWHTPFPLITAAVGEMNKVEILVYEDIGIHNLDLVQFGLGAEYLGEPLHDVEVLVELHFETDNTTHGIKISDITIRDDDNLIENTSISADAYVTECIDDAIQEECVKINLEYFYREAPINNMMVVSASDKHRNTQMFYFNHGVKVVGESMNPVPSQVIYNKHSNQQTEDLSLVLSQKDKVNSIWTDEHGIEYLKVSENRFDRITPQAPYQCNDPPLDTINVPTRNNCHFRELVAFWQ